MRRPLAAGLLCLFLPAIATAQTVPATVPALQPLPDPAAQTQARDLIHTLFKDDYAKKSPADQAALARRLLAEAQATKDDLTARYVLLTESATLGAAGADLLTALAAAGELTRTYAVNGLDLKCQIIFRAGAASPPAEACEGLARAALEVADEAALVDNFEAAKRLVDVAETAVARSKRVALAAALQPRIAAQRALAEEYTRVLEALARLQKDPNDAAAHSAVGRFYALHKGDFATGLAHLALGEDPELRRLADADLAGPADPFKQVELGDAWWNYAGVTESPTRLHATARARHWYALAKGTITGFTLTRIDARLQTGDARPAAATTMGAPVALPPGGAVHLIPRIDPAKDAAQGQWTVTGEELRCASGKYAVLALPYNPPEEFDLCIAFTRTEGQGPITVLLASHNRNFDFSLDIKGEARFERVGGKIAKDNPTLVPVSISNNHRYTLTLRLRRDSISALLDDKPLTQWKTDYKDLSRYALWRLPDDRLCGLGANNAQVTFHSVDLIEINGAGKPTR